MIEQLWSDSVIWKLGSDNILGSEDYPQKPQTHSKWMLTALNHTKSVHPTGRRDYKHCLRLGLTVCVDSLEFSSEMFTTILRSEVNINVDISIWSSNRTQLADVSENTVWAWFWSSVLTRSSNARFSTLYDVWIYWSFTKHGGVNNSQQLTDTHNFDDYKIISNYSLRIREAVINTDFCRKLYRLCQMDQERCCFL